MPSVSQYPRPGKVALLCEGDLIGYEATLFQKWTGTELGTTPLVDIWPCGTATSIRGVSDAIGRSRPIFIVEDRDFRSSDECFEDCARHRDDRERRGVRVIQWTTWNRCEVENYLLEPDVLLPVFREAFGCSDLDITNALGEILAALALFQASQYALWRARRSWLSTDPVRILLSGLHSRPQWNDTTHGIVPPDVEAFRSGLERQSNAWVDQLHATPSNTVSDFDDKFALWKGCRYQDDFWRIDWAGKDILHWLRIAMTSRFGWIIDPESSQRHALNWGMGREKRDAQDRKIEVALRPRLIDRFLSALPTLDKSIRDEFDAIKTDIQSAEL